MSVGKHLTDRRKTKDRLTKGVEFVVDDSGRGKAVLIEEWGDLWEDFYDVLVSESRKNEPTVPSQNAFIYYARDLGTSGNNSSEVRLFKGKTMISAVNMDLDGGHSTKKGLSGIA